MQRKIAIALATLLAVVIWAGLALQLYVFVRRSLALDLGALHGVLLYFNYFTNLANLFAAITITMWLRHERAAYGVNPYQRRIASLVVYVWLAGVIYNLLLRHLMPAYAPLFVSNVILHDLVPLLMLAFWGLCIPHARLGFRDAASWLQFPLLYFVYVLLSGHVTGRYPYPFLDVTRFGYLNVCLNALQIAAATLGLSLLLLALNSFKARVVAVSAD